MMKVNGLAPKNIDNTGKEEDVEDDDEKGGQGEDKDAIAVVHPTVDGVVVVPEVSRDYEKKINRQKKDNETTISTHKWTQSEVRRLPENDKKTKRQLFPANSVQSLRQRQITKRR